MLKRSLHAERLAKAWSCNFRMTGLGSQIAYLNLSIVKSFLSYGGFTSLPRMHIRLVESLWAQEEPVSVRTTNVSLDRPPPTLAFSVFGELDTALRRFRSTMSHYKLDVIYTAP